MRHYWVDRLIEVEPGVRALGVKNVALSEDVFTDHFPGNPVYPGIYLLEGLAQTAGLLLERTSGGKRFALMVSVERGRFVSFARPGDQLKLEVEIESLEEEYARVKGSAHAGDRLVGSARFTFKLLETDQFIPPAFREAWDHSLAVWRGEYPMDNDD
jgi:3-hydroxyacyl-[acyl-carrier-protein] dehydratase